MVKSDKMQKN